MALVETKPPICVDLDGSLIHSDSLLECLFALLRHRPWQAILLPFWLGMGRARFKQRLAAYSEFDVSHWPYRAALIKWLLEMKAAGHALVLATGADRRVADSVAGHLGIFDSVIASDGQVNLTGSAKAASLVRTYGEGGFIYVGNSAVDLKVWGHARSAVVVGGNSRLPGRVSVETSTPIEATFMDTPHLAAIEWAKALRVHQWAKNLLLAVPLLAAHRIDDPQSWGLLLQAFFAFGGLASAIYILNDLIDLPSDRCHPRKRHRPFASARLSLAWGLALPGLLLLFSALLMVGLPTAFVHWALAYLLLTTAYTWWLKRMALVDVATLAGLYTLRILAGAAVVDVPLSFWLLLFSALLFFDLALIKRVAELVSLQREGGARAAGRGYGVEDTPVLQGMGYAAAVGSVLVLALYMQSPVVNALYGAPTLLALLCPILLLWLSRLWLLTNRGAMHDDPLVFAMRDPSSWLLGLLSAILVVLASGEGL